MEWTCAPQTTGAPQAPEGAKVVTALGWALEEASDAVDVTDVTDVTSTATGGSCTSLHSGAAMGGLGGSWGEESST